MKNYQIEHNGYSLNVSESEDSQNSFTAECKELNLHLQGHEKPGMKGKYTFSTLEERLKERLKMEVD